MKDQSMRLAHAMMDNLNFYAIVERPFRNAHYILIY